MYCVGGRTRLERPSSERDYPLRERPQLLGLVQWCLYPLMDDQRGAKIPEQSLPVFRSSAQFSVIHLVSHFKLPTSWLRPTGREGTSSVPRCRTNLRFRFLN